MIDIRLSLGVAKLVTPITPGKWLSWSSQPFISQEFFKTEQKVSYLMDILTSAKVTFKHLEQPTCLLL